MTIPTRFDTVSPEGGTVVLIQCPECELNVSDKALACPHCGCPMTKNIKAPSVRTRHNKRRRLPNGFGQISEIKNRNLRKPFRAMVTVGKNDNGKPICKPLKPDSYFETYNEAYAALVAYNKNPYSLDSGISVAELYERWTKEYFKTLKSRSSQNSIEAAWAYCSKIYNIRATDLRGYHIKGCIEEGRAMIHGKERITNSNTKCRIKSLFNLMLDYAVEYELVDKNYSRTFTLSNEIVNEAKSTVNEHIPFSDLEMEVLWNNLNIVDCVDILIIQCYSGWRPQELGLIRVEDVDLTNCFFKGGIKTEAGIERSVPIHSRILPLVEKRYAEALSIHSDFLFNCFPPNGKLTDRALTYRRYQLRFDNIVKTLQLDAKHRPHDGRKHFVTMAKKAGVDEYAIKYMVGHAIDDITEKIYTQREESWLKKEIEKIK